MKEKTHSTLFTPEQQAHLQKVGYNIPTLEDFPEEIALQTLRSFGYGLPEIRDIQKEHSVTTFAEALVIIRAERAKHKPDMKS